MGTKQMPVQSDALLGKPAYPDIGRHRNRVFDTDCDWSFAAIRVDN